MINYTTPTITLTIEGCDLTDKEVYVSLEQGKKILTKKSDELDISVDQGNTIIEMPLTQEESGYFDYNLTVSVQVNWISSDGIRAATEIKNIKVMPNLLNEVIEYGEN